MKWSILFLLLSISLTAFADNLTPKQIQDKLEFIDKSISTLFEKIDRPLYSDYSLKVAYERYHREAEKILLELENLERDAKLIGGEYSSDKEFYIRLANLNIAQLKIRQNRETFLSYLKFKNDPQEYKDQMIIWERKEGFHQKDLRKQIEKIRIIDNNNIYSDIFESIANYFEGNISTAIDKMEAILKKFNKKENFPLSEDEIDNLDGFCNSWMAFFYLKAGRMEQFNEFLVQTISSKGPAASITWANDARRAWESNKKEGVDFFIRKFEAENQNISKDFFLPKISFDSKGKVTSFKIEEGVVKEFPSPEMIASKLSNAANRLWRLEQESWSNATNQLNKNAKKEKDLFLDPTKIVFELNLDKKAKNSTKPFNVIKHVDLVEKYNDIIKDLITYRAVWTALIRSNPDVPMYRYYRILNNLIIQKAAEKSEYLYKSYSFLKYQSKKTEKPSSNQLTEFKEQLHWANQSEIKGDLDVLQRIAPNAAITILAHIQSIAVTESPRSGISLIASQIDKISPNETVEGKNPKMFAETAKLAVMFNSSQYDSRDYKESLNYVSDFPFAETWLSTLKSRANYLREEKEIIGKFKKPQIYKRYLSESILPLLYFPVNQKCNYITEPPLFMPQSIKLTLESINSQYFRIAILPVVDMTDRAENYRNSIADMFYTALFDTKRFSLMDRLEVTRIQDNLSQNLQDKLLTSKNQGYAIDSSSNQGGIVTQKEELELLSKLFQKNTATQQEYKDVANQLQRNADGVLLIYITTDLKSIDGHGGKVGIDYRITSTKTKDVLFAGHKDLGYRFDRATETLLFNRNDVDEVAEEIKKKFPNPDLNENFRIIARRGNRITVNAGKDDNITTGLEGFVVKLEQDLYGNNLIRFRAEFIVKEVFPNTFTAELVSDGDMEKLRVDINRTIEIGEPIKMK